MLHNVILENFKCFYKTASFPMRRVNVLYGKNGRGKSSFVQSLLLLAQSMRQNNEISRLNLMGDFVSVGTFNDVKSFNSNVDSFRICLDGDENVELTFSEYPNKPQLAVVSGLVVDGVNRLEFNSDANQMSSTDGEKHVGATSDVITFQKLKKTQFVTAGRLGPVNSTMRHDALPQGWQGVNGEFLIDVLDSNGIEFLEKVEKHLSHILSGAAIKIDKRGNERIDLYLNSINNNATFKPVNVGFGYSYVLPVITAALMAEKDSLLVIENPEAHLHTGAQSRLMDFLIKMSVEREFQLVVETHSDHVVNGLRLATKNGCVGRHDSVILYFEHNNETVEPIVTEIHCDSRGELDCYPEDFMDEWTKQMIDLLKT